MIAAGRWYVTYGSRKDVFRLWNLADIHWMNKACAEDKVRADCAEIKRDPFSLWIGGGDYADFIGYRDKRFDPDAVAPWVPVKKLGDLGRYGMEQIRNLFLPIRDKCCGLIVGNHELRYELATEQESLHSWLCTELDVPSLGYSCLFDLLFVRKSTKRPTLSRVVGSKSETFSRKRFRIFAHHGAGYAQTPGGKLNRLVGFMQSFDADIYMVGHVHDNVARHEPALGADDRCSSIVQRQRLGIVAGSYLKTYQQGTTTYGEQRGYRPTSLNAAVAIINPEHGTIQARV
jgi:hypothetical protein